ncbi:hypothetical protein DSL72_002550 [Monilinia vaccinii-corymbosi]|uniref:Glucose-methanol-choline oxidoreductase C-terminal domain-containing protein n=1 Tax=Monilinia vaccinii-corymbosi TaxID=61207 RepID=A0A8A3PCV2_9HELO|nr:hypothetical protein DSL72_002550 [Monilinia vaccinii-corymbosi]
MLTLPTSRGEVTLASSSPNDVPSMDPNYFSTCVDKAALIHGVQRLLQCLSQTTSGQDFIETEEEIEERIQSTGTPHLHVAGSCAMGVVVDADLRVNGVRGLRIVDASVFPVPLGGHPQATLYGIAERAAAMITGEKDEFER